MRPSAPAVLSPHPTCGTLPLQPGTGALTPPLCVPQGTPGPWCWGCPRPGPRWPRLAPGCSPSGTCPRGTQRLHHHCGAFSLSLPWCFQSEPVWFPDLRPRPLCLPASACRAHHPSCHSQTGVTSSSTPRPRLPQLLWSKSSLTGKQPPPPPPTKL